MNENEKPKTNAQWILFFAGLASFGFIVYHFLRVAPYIVPQSDEFICMDYLKHYLGPGAGFKEAMHFWFMNINNRLLNAPFLFLSQPFEPSIYPYWPLIFHFCIALSFFGIFKFLFQVKAILAVGSALLLSSLLFSLIPNPAQWYFWLPSSSGYIVPLVGFIWLFIYLIKPIVKQNFIIKFVVTILAIIFLVLSHELFAPLLIVTFLALAVFNFSDTHQRNLYLASLLVTGLVLLLVFQVPATSARVGRASTIGNSLGDAVFSTFLFYLKAAYYNIYFKHLYLVFVIGFCWRFMLPEKGNLKAFTAFYAAATALVLAMVVVFVNVYITSIFPYYNRVGNVFSFFLFVGFFMSGTGCSFLLAKNSYLQKVSSRAFLLGILLSLAGLALASNTRLLMVSTKTLATYKGEWQKRLEQLGNIKENQLAIFKPMVKAPKLLYAMDLNSRPVTGWGKGFATNYGNFKSYAMASNASRVGYEVYQEHIGLQENLDFHIYYSEQLQLSYFCLPNSKEYFSEDLKINLNGVKQTIEVNSSLIFANENSIFGRAESLLMHLKTKPARVKFEVLPQK